MKLRTIGKAITKYFVSGKGRNWPLPIRQALFQLGRYLLAVHYRLPLSKLKELADGETDDCVQVINAHRFLADCNCTQIDNEGRTHYQMLFSERGLLPLLAYASWKEDWIQMLSVCGIHLEILDNYDIQQKLKDEEVLRVYYLLQDDDEE